MLKPEFKFWKVFLFDTRDKNKYNDICFHEYADWNEDGLYRNAINFII